MAIQIDLQQSNFGIPFAGAYFRIVTACVSRQRQEDLRHSVLIDVVGYAAQPEDEDTKEVDLRRYHVPLAEIETQAGPDFLEKAYQWVMLHPDMTGSIAA